MAGRRQSSPDRKRPGARAREREPDEAMEIETGPDGPAPVDPMAPGKSLFEDDEEAVEPNEPA
jgi:hypothetical protein